MPIKVKFEKEFILDDSWCDKKDFDEVFKNDREAFVEFISEDLISVLEDAGMIKGLLKEYSWVSK